MNVGTSAGWQWLYFKVFLSISSYETNRKWKWSKQTYKFRISLSGHDWTLLEFSCGSNRFIYSSLRTFHTTGHLQQRSVRVNQKITFLHSLRKAMLNKPLELIKSLLSKPGLAWQLSNLMTYYLPSVFAPNANRKSPNWEVAKSGNRQALL